MPRASFENLDGSTYSSKAIELDDSTGYPILRTTQKGIDLCKHGGQVSISINKKPAVNVLETDVDWMTLIKTLQSQRPENAQLMKRATPYIIFQMKASEAWQEKTDRPSVLFGHKRSGEKSSPSMEPSFLSLLETHKKLIQQRIGKDELYQLFYIYRADLNDYNSDLIFYFSLIQFKL